MALVAKGIRVLKFETRYKRVEGKDVIHDWVLYGPGDGIKDCQTWSRVDHMIPPDDEEGLSGDKIMYMKAIWAAIEPSYQAWKAGNELPTNGIPLSAWAGVNEGQIAELGIHKIRTVEDVAKISDAAIQKIRLPDVRGLRKQAKAYLDGIPVAEANKKMTDLEEQLAAAMEMIEELQKKPKKKEKEAA